MMEKLIRAVSRVVVALVVISVDLLWHRHLTRLGGLALAIIVITLIVAPALRTFNRTMDRIGGIPPRDPEPD
jgi:MFS superfamily sulfate permease-like transporter